MASTPSTSDPMVDPEEREFMNKGAYQAVYVLFLILAVILNAFTAGVIVRIFVTRRKGRKRYATRLSVILACCVVEFLASVVPYPLNLSLRITRDLGVSVPCSQHIAACVGYCMCDSLTILVITVLTLAETMKKGVLLKLNWKKQFVCTMALLAASVLYVFLVDLPVVLTGWVADMDDPCVDSYNVTSLKLNPDPDKKRAMPAVKYLLPTLMLIVAQVLLTLSDFMKPRTSPNQAQRQVEAQPEEPVDPFADELKKRLGVKAKREESPGHENKGSVHIARVKKLLEAVDVRAAALLVVILYFPEFVMLMRDDAKEPGPDVTVGYLRLDAACEIMKVLVLVLVPCCWWIKKTLRYVVCCYIPKHEGGQSVKGLIQFYNRKDEEAAL